MDNEFLITAKKQFLYYKTLGEKTINLLDQDKLNWKPNEESNSIANIIQHLSGNMLSRWTDFLNSDGEKTWRNRDGEFEDFFHSKEALLLLWEKGWNCLFDALNGISEIDFDKKITIRYEVHSLQDAIHRQLAHYPYHIGQIVYIGKLLLDKQWNSLSIPKNKSEDFNKKMGI